MLHVKQQKQLSINQLCRRREAHHPIEGEFCNQFNILCYQPVREETVRVFRHFGLLLLGVVSLLMGQALASEEPRGLLLRKGLVNWQVTLNEAGTFIEENIHPKTLRLLRNQKEEGLRCEREAIQGVSHCVWACCVDLGEKDIVHFATLWFYNDRFYAYDVAFDTVQFPRLLSTLATKFGKPSKEEQESQVAPNFMMGGMSTYIVNTKHWDLGNAVVLLSDRGGQGKPLAVAYMPLLRETIPAKKEDNETGAKLPF